jgi:hypothetical protein
VSSGRARSGEAFGGTAFDRAMLLVGVAGMAFCITLVFLAMRAVLDIGGACADGGPYIPRVSCPDGVPLAMVGGIFGLFLFGGITGWYGSRLGSRYVGIVFLAWPALFISLGWNFLEYGFNPPGDDGGWAWGWLIPGVLFMLMGAGPLLAALPGRSGRAASASVYPIPNRLSERVTERTTRAPASRQALLRQLGAALRSEAAERVSDEAPAPEDADLVSRLERLEALHRRGALDNTEFTLAKHALILEAQRSGPGGAGARP